MSQQRPSQGQYNPNYQTPKPSDPLSGLIPYKNSPALISYYLGVFSILPCIGAALGIAAIILGIIGLKKAALNPEAKGKGHAIAGIICGALFGLGWLVVGLIIIIAAASN